MRNYDNDLKIDVLVSSPGPHDVVRVRQPFKMLQDRGINVRIHERPFNLYECIREKSITIWQRPLPDSWEQQNRIFNFIRKKKSLLITEWDDHPNLLPKLIRKKLIETEIAPLRICHLIQTSSAILSAELKTYHPIRIVIENFIDTTSRLNIDKHKQDQIKILICNQNRGHEHKCISKQLKIIINKHKNIHIVIIGDKELYNYLGPEQCTLLKTQTYSNYRSILRQCHISLLPLEYGIENRCKTVIKWTEAAAESTATVTGPELYGLINSVNNEKAVCINCVSLHKFGDTIEKLISNLELRMELVKNSYYFVKWQWSLEERISERIKYYEYIWKKKELINKIAINHIEKYNYQNKLMIRTR